MIATTLTYVPRPSKKPQKKYPVSIDVDLFEAAQKLASDEYTTFPLYLKRLIETDLKAKGRWPLPPSPPKT